MVNERRMINVAIDGPAGAGKSTVAQRVAHVLGFIYVDTGAMYRAMTLAWMRDRCVIDAQFVMAHDVTFVPVDGHLRIHLDGSDVHTDVRSPEVSQHVASVSAHRVVRERLVALQRGIAANGGVVMDGRDIGTAVLPDAAVKVFLTASVDVRAARRCVEWEGASFDDVVEAIRARDERDATREQSPLICAPDAIRIDSSHMSIDAVVGTIVHAVQAVMYRV